MSNCGRKGRCCNNGLCSTDVGSCQCQSCGEGYWYADNNCLPGACWIVVDGTYVCEQHNPCECEYRGGEFNGPGTLCPDSGEGPPPPPPPPPPGEEPGPVLVYCCNRDIGACYTREYACLPGETRYWSAASCDRSCQQSVSPPEPEPEPDPPQPCDPACDACSDCVNGTCVSRCNPCHICHGGTCGPSSCGVCDGDPGNTDPTNCACCPSETGGRCPGDCCCCPQSQRPVNDLCAGCICVPD